MIAREVESGLFADGKPVDCRQICSVCCLPSGRRAPMGALEKQSGVPNVVCILQEMAVFVPCHYNYCNFFHVDFEIVHRHM